MTCDIVLFQGHFFFEKLKNKHITSSSCRSRLGRSMSWLSKTVGNIANALDELDNQVEGLLDQTPTRSKMEARTSRRPKYVSRSERPRFPTPSRTTNDDDDDDEGVYDVEEDEEEEEEEEEEEGQEAGQEEGEKGVVEGGVVEDNVGGKGKRAEVFELDSSPTATQVDSTKKNGDQQVDKDDGSKRSAAAKATTRSAQPPSRSNPSADLDIVSMLQAENNRLKDRIRSQDAELEAIDAQMLDTQEELEKLELTHSSYCDDAEDREKDLQRRVRELEGIASSSTDSGRQVLREKNNEIEHLKSSLSEMESSNEASLSFVRQQLEDVTMENETLEEKCREYKGQSRNVGEGRAHIIAELQEEMEAMEQQRSEFFFFFFVVWSGNIVFLFFSFFSFFFLFTTYVLTSSSSATCMQEPITTSMRVCSRRASSESVQRSPLTMS